MNKEILKKVEGVIAPLLENLHYRLVDLELVFERTQVLRIYIDKEGGVTIRDCEVVSRAIGDNLDAEEIFTRKYRLEVSSPGLDRPLKTQEDFKKYCGSIVQIKTHEPIEGRSNYKGEIKDIRGDEVTVLIDGREYKIPLEQILRARLVPAF